MLHLCRHLHDSEKAQTNLVKLQRLQGKQVRFVTGTDEHGEKIADAAKARGMQPKEHCDSIVEEYKSLWAQVTPLTKRFCSP